MNNALATPEEINAARPRFEVLMRKRGLDVTKADIQGDDGTVAVYIDPDTDEAWDDFVGAIPHNRNRVKPHQTALEKFYDGTGNVGEIACYSDGLCMARLKRLGASRSEIRTSKDNTIGILWHNAAEPDEYYDRFEGNYAAATAWMKGKGFAKEWYGLNKPTLAA